MRILRTEVLFDMLTVFARTVILYFVSVIAMRLMGKRQVGQLQPYEFVLAIMIADLATAPMEGVGTPLGYGLVPILALVFLHGLGTLLSMKLPLFRRVLSGAPSVIMRNGAICYGEMKRMNYTMTDLLEELRAQGFLNIAQVCTAVLETSGKLSVFPYANQRPLTPQDMNLCVPCEGIPMTLIVDGRVQPTHLKKCGLDENWLKKQLKPLGITDFTTVALCSLDTAGMLFAQEANNEKTAHRVEALDAKKAVW